MNQYESLNLILQVFSIFYSTGRVIFLLQIGVSRGKMALRCPRSLLKIEEILNLVEKKVIVEQCRKSGRT